MSAATRMITAAGLPPYRLAMSAVLPRTGD
jgi:hypothetical protein